MTTEKEKLLWIYTNSLKSRYLDEILQQAFYGVPRNKYRGEIRLLHSAVGNEFGPSAVAAFLKSEDFLLPRYRGYAAILGKGVPAENIIAEIIGRRTGTAKGIGDTTPLHCPRYNVFGTSLVLGSNFSVAVGLALTKKIKEKAGIVVQFFGDGEASRTTFGSALNLAALWELPILFICENDGRSLGAKGYEISATTAVADRAKGYNVKAETVRETEILKAFERARFATEKVRATKRPFLFEIIEQRSAPQSSLYPGPFTAEMLPKSQDPLMLLEEELEKAGVAKAVLENLKGEVRNSVDEAAGQAKKAEPLSPEEFLTLYHE